MQHQCDDAAFFAFRIAASNAKADESTESCARASHLGIAKGYRRRLAALQGQAPMVEDDTTGQY